MIKNIYNVSKTLGFKIFTILILGLLLLIPMNFIKSVVLDRRSYQREAVTSIIEPIGGVANIEGLIIAIPYIKKVIYEKEITYKREYIFYMPNNYNISGNIEINLLKRGIFKVPILNSTLNIKGKFDKYNSNLYNLDKNDTTILFDEAIMIFGVGNKKNLLKLPKIMVNQNEELEYYEKTVKINLLMFSNIFLFNISKDKLIDGFEFETSIDIQGGNSLIINPMASDNYFNISSSWNDPSFTGGFIPTKREISKNGFNAKWNIASFNTSYNKYWTSEEYDKNEYKEDNQNNVIISFLLLNDNYQKILRSVKYSILFIFIPFFVLFLCEVISKKRIHPVQYILIGISNAIFYLLLLAISEHINFNISYLISAIMVILLTSIYIGYIIKSKKYILSMAIVETLIYIFLFGILQLTDYALLMGTLGLFISIAAGMYFSRNVDWYGENN